MKNRSIALIIVLFSLMLIGIIGIQAWWINRSLKLNEQAFDAAVYRSLEGVVSQTEKKENYTLIKQEFGRDSIMNILAKQKLKGIKPHKSKVFTTESFTYSGDLDDKDFENASVKVEVGQNGKKLMVVAKSNAPDMINKKGNEIGGVQSGKNVTIISSDNAPDVVNIEGNEELGNINKKLQNLDTLIQKMVSIKSDDSISITPADIDSLLHTQLKQNHLPLLFSFALLGNKGHFSFKSKSFKDTSETYKVSLYPNDLFGRNIHLLVNFPGKFEQVSAGIWWAFILSLLFTSAMLALFIYSIRMLIQHKNLLVAKNDFISHMSHEFKTPLAGISIGADMIAEKGDKMTLDQITKVAHSIKEQSIRLNKDVSSVLLSAMVDEKQSVLMQPFNLVEVINEEIDSFKFLINNLGAKVETSFQSEKTMIVGDRMLWQKVIANLLDNSLKFSKETPLITIRITELNPNKVILEFSDNAVGISKEDLPHIFEKFYRSDYQNKSNIQGFGLGLSFVKKVIDMRGGTIKALSEQGKGTTMIIEINKADV